MVVRVIRVANEVPAPSGCDPLHVAHVLSLGVHDDDVIRLPDLVQLGLLDKDGADDVLAHLAAVEHKMDVAFFLLAIFGDVGVPLFSKAKSFGLVEGEKAAGLIGRAVFEGGVEVGHHVPGEVEVTVDHPGEAVCFAATAVVVCHPCVICLW